MREWIEQRASDVAGWFGISVGVTSEVGQRLAWWDTLTVVQVVSMAGVIFMMVDRTINSIDSLTPKAKKIIWSICWTAFFFVTVLAL